LRNLGINVVLTPATIKADYVNDDNINAQNNYSFLARKDRVIADLKDAFTSGFLNIEAYESRVAIAENSKNITELDVLLSDLPKTELNKRPTQISESEILNCNMVTKKYDGTVLQTKKLNLETSMSTVELDYTKLLLMKGIQEINLKMNMSNLIIFVPDDITVENSVQENMSTYKEYRNKYYGLIKTNTILRITGSARMSKIEIKWTEY
jgi:hypothetical protein